MQVKWLMTWVDAVIVECAGLSTGPCFLERTQRAPLHFLVLMKLGDYSLNLRSLGSLFHSTLPQTSMDSHNLFLT